MDRNIKVARAHRAIAWLYVLILGAAVAIMASAPKEIGSPSVVAFTFATIMFIAHFITARGAWRSMPWARTSSIVIAVLLLFGFPIGTLIGLYLLANTWRPWEAPHTSAAVA